MSQLIRYVPMPTRMSFADRLRWAIRGTWRGPFSTKDPALAKLFGAGYESAAGIIVNENNWHTFSAVFDAVNQISADVGKLPLNLRKRRKEGGSDDYIDSHVYWLLKNEPNPEIGAMEFRRTLTAHALTCHGGYAEIERDRFQRPIALWILTPDRVRPYREETLNRDGTKRLGPLRYEIDAGPTTLEARDVLHIHGLGYDGTVGYEMINLARQAIGLALASEKFASTVFKTGRFGGILHTDDDLDDEQQKVVRESIQKYKQGFEQFLLLFNRKWSYEKTAVSSNDAQLKDTRDAQVEEVARFFNMPVYKLKLSKPGSMSYASNEAQKDDYYQGCLLNWLTPWEQELNRKLISPLERRQQFFKHNANGFLRGDIKTRYDALGVARDKGIINADEWREIEDMNPQEGGQGKLYLVQSAQVPLNLLEDYTKAQIEKAKAKTPPPTPPASNTPAPADGDADRTIAVLKDRAERAEQLVRETLQSATEAREQLAALTAAGAAKDETLAALRASEERALAQAASLTELADRCRSDYQTALAARDADLAAAAAERDRLIADRDAARAAATAAAVALEDATALRTAAETGLATARAAETDALARAAAAQRDLEASLTERERCIRDADEARQLAADAASAASREVATAGESVSRMESERQALEQRAQTADTAVQAAEAAALEAQRTADAARQAADQAEAARAQLAQDLHDATTREAEATTALTEARDALAAHGQELETLRTQGAALAATGEELRLAQAALEQTAADTTRRLEAELAAARTAQQQAEETAQATRERLVSRMTATIAAHRGLILDAMGRMTRREADNARAKQATPEKLRRWLASFGSVHEAVCVEALTPAIRTHLAWKGASDDPLAVTTTLVREHLALFTRILSDVLDAPAEDFHAELDRALTQWETTRAGDVADAVLREEIDHVRAQQ